MKKTYTASWWNQWCTRFQNYYYPIPEFSTEGRMAVLKTALVVEIFPLPSFGASAG